VGGTGDSSKSIERYSFQFDKWEVLAVLLPDEFINPGLYLVDSNKLAILGGRKSELVLVLEEDSFVRENPGKINEEIFRVYNVGVLPNKLISFYPPVFVLGKNLVYFINDRFMGKPDILEFPVKKFMIQGNKLVNEFKNVSKAGTNLPVYNRLLTPSFVDVYY
jgi:hypothetical protein